MLTEPPDKVAAGAGALLEAVGSASDEQELAALVLQLGQLRDQAALQSLASLRQHSSATVRRAVAEALPLAMVDGASASAGVEALIGLCSDDDAEVRDWAACSLGRSLAADAAELRAFYDTPEIRAALWARVADDDPATRAEACAGLALRHVGELKHQFGGDSFILLELGEADFIEGVGGGVVVDQIICGLLIGQEGGHAFNHEVVIVGAERGVVGDLHRLPC